MKTIVLDFETYYDSEYSLRKMTPVEYVLDPRFEVIGCAVRDSDWPEKSRFLSHEELVTYLAGLPEKVVVVSHNALFDMVILAWWYGYVPTLMADTLGMARAMLGHRLRSLSLDNVASFLKLGAKGKTVQKVQGMTLAAIKAQGLYDEYADYSRLDAELCYQIYRKLIAQGFPPAEIVVMDTVLRCAVMPRFVLNQNLLAEHLLAVQQGKAELLHRAGLSSRDDLMSNDRFADALRALGVEPPTKVSPVTGKEAYAFAKTDADFIDLEEHDNPDVQALVSARLGLKSTIEETRTERFIKIARLEWGGGQQGLLPVPLRYSGAHTHRLCLTGGTIIVVLRDNRVVYVRLDTLRGNDLVWDGEMFVRHGGLSYAGMKEVITYDGVTGTPDHRVWTLEHGYCELAQAKARGYDIARGDLPDPARIDPALYGVHQVCNPNTVHMFSMWGGNGQPVVGFGRSGEGSVPVLPHEGDDAWEATFAGNDGCGESSQCCCYAGTQGKMEGGAPYTPRESVCEGPGESSWGQMVSGGLEDSVYDRREGTTTVHEPSGVQFPILRRARHRIPVQVDSVHGGLDLGKPGSETGRDVDRQSGLQRALRPGKSALGDKAGPSEEPVEQHVWDIIDCGPRNRFMANGRIVHNSGDWKLNLQNLPSRVNNKLRKAITAPAGHKVLAVDSSQIEARIAAWFCGCMEMVQQFANKEDVYSTYASSIFGYPVNKKEHPTERFVGKTGILGNQYGLGWLKFQGTVAMQSAQAAAQGLIPAQILLSDADAAKAINTYRNRYHQIPRMWSQLGALLPQMTGPLRRSIGPVTFEKEAVLLPSGLKLFYHNLRCDEGGQWRFEHGGATKYIYGGKMLENIVQALARICVMDAAVRVRKWADREGIPIWLNLQVHDELVYVVPDELVELVDAKVMEEMNRRPSWAPDLPLDSESGVGVSFGDT